MIKYINGIWSIPIPADLSGPIPSCVVAHNSYQVPLSATNPTSYHHIPPLTIINYHIPIPDRLTIIHPHIGLNTKTNWLYLSDPTISTWS